MDVKECPVGSRHRAAVPATAAKKTPYLCWARSWVMKRTNLCFLWLEPIYYKFNQIPSSSRTMIHLATFSYSVASLDLKLRSVFEQLNFGSAHVSFKKLDSFFIVYWVYCSKIGRFVIFQPLASSSAMNPRPSFLAGSGAPRVPRRSIQASQGPRWSLGSSRPQTLPQLTKKGLGRSGWYGKSDFEDSWKWYCAVVPAKALKALAVLGFLSFWTFFAVQCRPCPCRRQDL